MKPNEAVRLACFIVKPNEETNALLRHLTMKTELPSAFGEFVVHWQDWQNSNDNELDEPTFDTGTQKGVEPASLLPRKVLNGG